MPSLAGGLSETVAIVVLVGLAASFSIAFIVYIQSDYGVRHSLALLQRVVELERMSSVVRLVHATDESALYLFKRLDGGSGIAFFLDDGDEYIDCADVVREVSGGAIVQVREYDVGELLVVSRDGVYSYRHYARARGFPDRGRVRICILNIERNAVVALALAKPAAQGYNLTTLESRGRSWRLYGSLRLRIVGAGVNHYLYIDGAGHPLRVGQNIWIDVDSRVGVLKLDQLKRVDSFSTYAKAVYIDGALLARNANVGISRGVVVDIVSSTLSIEVQPEPTGYIKLSYYGQQPLSIERSEDGSYVRVVGWAADRERGLNIQMDQSRMYAEGAAHTVYIVQRGAPRAFLRTVRLYTVAVVNGVPYLVDVYEYRFGTS
ncbi:MAG: hypothetical protein N3D82_03490 [Ignisphaera sp.]|nr:hypothetical protein [Ignisphaera sp.]MCX8168072.1 hypothetical protein [Ignisphaera sp.]MDW8086305.1 hypothetical protein [Ignisphaera sp.]